MFLGSGASSAKANCPPIIVKQGRLEPRTHGLGSESDQSSCCLSIRETRRERDIIDGPRNLTTLQTLHHLIKILTQPLSSARLAMISTPHYQEDRYSMSPKRKRDANIPKPARLQTTNLDTPRSRTLSTTSIDDTLSPRAAMSVRMKDLRLQSSSSPTRRSSRKASVVADQDLGLERAVIFEEAHDDGPGISATPVVSDSGTEKIATDESHEETTLNHDIQQGIFEFRAGGMSQNSNPFEPKIASPFKRAAFVLRDDEDQTTPSPSKRQRCQSPSVSPSPHPVPRSNSPSARKLSHRSPPPSEPSSSPSDAELTQFWWQPSEIIGHDPNDPDEDNRGINGIGYQKTKAEQWRISEKKKRQIAEWRSREAKEARSLRAGGRRVIMGRVSKPGSRAGSPSDGTAQFRGRSSPTPRSVSDEKKMEEVVRRAVRFELG